MLTPAELDRLCVVLVATRNPLNIGAVARAMSNFGFSRLRLVAPYEVAFRAARSAVGAASLLADAREFKTVAEAVSDCSLVVGTTAGQNRKLQQPLQALAAAAIPMVAQLATGRVALLFGSEKRGLANDDLSHCHWLLQIPARPEHASINLGQAVALCLYELVRAGEPVGNVKGLKLHGARSAGESTDPATAGELERVAGLLRQVLDESSYPSQPGSQVQERTRRLVLRLDLSAADAAILQGMLRHILWKLRQLK